MSGSGRSNNPGGRKLIRMNTLDMIKPRGKKHVNLAETYEEGAEENSAADDREVKDVEDVIFDLFKEENKDVIAVARFLLALKETGLRTSDPRLKEMIVALKNLHLHVVGYPGTGESLSLDRESFKKVIADNIVLISKAFRGHFVIPDFPTLTKQIEEMYYKCSCNTKGNVATYIPQLARFKPEYWGVSICTTDGQR
ncbi:Glutaminase kidney isoform, mitochondrial [Nymphon striatum]|nr:Glutaminase kidney isoform, mitochondrial [Nymphon striatum]